jgi:hypothetical protein
MANRPIGYIRQQTVNCDYMVCSRQAKLADITAQSINVDKIVSPTLDTMLQTMKSKIEALEEVVQSLLNQTSAVYTAGSTIASTLHFDDIDLTDPDFDLDAYTLELREQLAQEAGVSIDHIIIIDLASTGSATARVEIRFPDSSDPVQNAEMNARREAFSETLKNPQALSGVLSSLGSVQMESSDEQPIQSVSSKLFQIEKMITGRELSFESAKELKLDTYKFSVEGDELRITRYDHETSGYVGGTLVVDT